MSKQIALKITSLLIGLGFLGLFAFGGSKALAANPTTINFQGKVTNSDGTNVTNGTYSFIFRIYNTSSPTTTTSCTSTASCLWEETQGSVTVTNGVFQVELGSVCALTSASCNNSTGGPINWSSTSSLYLTMKFNGDSAGFMTPTIHITSAPFALQADNAASLGGIAAANFVQLAQGVQTDTSTSAVSIFINKNNASGTPNILELQKSSSDVFVVGNSGGATISSLAATSGNAVNVLSVTGGAGASTATAGNGSNISLTAGAGGSGSAANGNGGSITLAAGAAGSGAGTAGTAGSVNFNVGATTIANVTSIGLNINSAAKLTLDGGTANQVLNNASGSLILANYAGNVLMQTNSFEIQNTGDFSVNFSTNSNGNVLFESDTNSSTAFQVLNSGGSPIPFLTVDTSGSQVDIGSGSTDATAIQLRLDSYNNATDPTGNTGDMYYNTADGTFRCYQGAWMNCIAPKLSSFTVLTSTTANSTYTVPSGVQYLLVEMVGAGGGGGGASGATSDSAAGGGGGSGGWGMAIITPGSTTSYKYTVGAAGTAGSSSAGTGGTGGESCFGTNATACTTPIIGCNGGVGGTGMAAGTTNTTAAGGTGGTCSGGSVNITGATGSRGSRATATTITPAISGLGASSRFGSGGAYCLGLEAGLAPATTSYGAGGGGGCNYNSATSEAGATGAQGVIIVWEFK